MTKLEISRNKLIRLQNEQAQAFQKGKDEFSAIPLGQPNIIGRKDIYKDGKKAYQKAYELEKEIKKQQDLIEKLENVEQFKKENKLLKDVHVVGKTGYATIGAKTSVNNLDYFKQQLAELETANEKAKEFNKLARKNGTIKSKTYGTEITKLKQKIASLESMKQKIETTQIGEKSQVLIDNGTVTQWKKKPIYYFVKGLKKVALELNDDGNFIESRRYYAITDTDKDFVAELLK